MDHLLGTEPIDPDDLRRIILDHISGSELDLSSAAFAGRPLQRFIDEFFPGSRLQLSGVTPPPEGSLELSGIGNCDPFKRMHVSAEFFIVEGQPELKWTATAKSGWNFAQSFAPARDTALCELAYSGSPQLLLNSHAQSATEHTGLFFTGKIMLAEFLGPLAWLLGELASLEISGAIQINANLPVMNLDSEEIPCSLPGFHLPLGAVVFAVQTKVTTNPSQQAVLRAGFSLSSSLKVTAKGTDRELTLSARFAWRPTIVTLMATDALDAVFDEVEKLLGISDLKSVLPENRFPPLEGEELKLQGVGIRLDLSKRKILALFATVGLAKPWNIVDARDGAPALAMDELAVTFQVEDPTGSKKASCAVFGDLAIEGGQLLTSAVYPGFSVAGELKPGTQIDAGKLLKSVIGEQADVPSLDINLLSFACNPETKAYSFDINVKSDWHFSLGSTSFKVVDMSLGVQHPSGQKGRAELGGAMAINSDTVLTVDWQLPGPFQLSARWAQIEISKAINLLASHRLDYTIKPIELTNAQVYVEKDGNGGVYMALGAAVEKYDAIELDFLESQKETGFVLGALLANSWVPSEISDDLKSLDFLKFEELAMILASFDDPHFQFRSFQDPSFTFPVHPPHTPTGIKKGMGLYGKLLLQGGSLDVVGKLLKGVSALELGAMVPTNYRDTELVASLNTHLVLLKVQQSDVIVLDEVSVNLYPEQSSIALNLAAEFAVHGHSVKVGGGIRIDEDELDFWLKTTTPWAEPFGIRGLTLDNLAIQFSMGEVETVTLAGEITIGGGPPPLVLTAAAEFNLEEEGLPDAFAVQEAGTIELSRLIDTFTGVHIPDALVDVTLSNFYCYVVMNPVGWDNPEDNKHYDPGLAFGGTLDFYGLHAYFAIQIDYATGIFANGYIEEAVDIGGIVKIANEQQPAKGPYIKINSANSPYLELSASFTLFEIVSESITAEVSNGAFQFTLKRQVAPLGELDITASLKHFDDFYLGAQAHFAVKNVGPIKVGKLNLGTLKVDLDLDAHFSIQVGPGQTFKLTVGALFEFQGLKLKFDDLTLDDRITKFSDLPKVFADNIAKVLWDIAKSLFQDAEALFEFIGKGLLEITEDIGKILSQDLHVALRDAAKFLKGVEHAIEADVKKVSELLKEGYEFVDHELVDALKYAGYEAEEIAEGVVHIFKLAAEDVAKLLHEAGIALEDVFKALKSVWNWSAHEVATLCKDVLKVADKLVYEALQEAGYVADEIKDAMEKVFNWAKSIWNKIKNKLNPKHW